MADLASRLVLTSADIASVGVDVVVSDASDGLVPPDGTASIIHRAAGPRLREALGKIGRCEPGTAVVTAGFDLPARLVIHAVGPAWRGGACGEASTLAACYRATLELALARDAETLAMPPIASGVLRYPPRPAALVAVRETCAILRRFPRPSRVLFCCAATADWSAYAHAVQQLYAHP